MTALAIIMLYVVILVLLFASSIFLRDLERIEAELGQATAILRRNLGLLRNDHTPNPEQSRRDYLDASRLCGVEPEDYS